MSIKSEMAYGILWSAIEKYSGLLISIIISSVLARLILPDQFGVVTIATVIINFLYIFSDMGIGSAIIQHKDLSDTELDSIFSLTFCLGLILVIIFYLLAYPISRFYGNVELIKVCHILCINLFFASINVVPQAHLLKDKKFKLIAKRTLILQIFTGIISVYLAYRGAGIYALLISPVVTSIGIFLINFRYRRRKLSFDFNFSPIHRIFAFSIYNFLFTCSNFLSRNLDSIIIGRTISMKDLGIYDKAYRLMLLPLQNVTFVINPIIQPVFSQFQGDKNVLAKNYNSIIKLLAAISFPLSVFLFFSGEEIITILYGENWNQSIPIFKILSLSLSFQLILSTSGSIYQSAYMTKYMFINGILNTFFTSVSFLVAAFLFKSLISFAWAWNISLSINFAVSYFILYKFVLKSKLSDMIKLLFLPLISSILIAFFLYLINYYFNINFFLSLILKLSITIILHTSIIQLSKYYDIIKLLRND